MNPRLRIVAALVGVVAPAPVLLYFSLLWFSILAKGISFAEFSQHVGITLFYSFVAASGWIGLSTLAVLVFRMKKGTITISWTCFTGIWLGLIAAMFFVVTIVSSMRHTKVQSVFDLFPLLVLGPILVSVIVLFVGNKSWQKTISPNQAENSSPRGDSLSA